MGKVTEKKQLKLIVNDNEIRFYRSDGKFGFLSNLYPCRVLFEQRIFRNSEEAYQFGKPKDLKVAEWIVAAPVPSLTAIAAHSLPLLGYQIKPDWKDIKLERMREVLFAKFTQNRKLAEKLLATGDKVLIEASKTDAYWGIGRKGTGENMLGKLLMEVRKTLKAVEGESLC